MHDLGHMANRRVLRVYLDEIMPCIMLIVSYAFLGTEEISTMIENPFENRNECDLPVDKMCNDIRKDALSHFNLSLLRCHRTFRPPRTWEDLRRFHFHYFECLL